MPLDPKSRGSCSCCTSTGTPVGAQMIRHYPSTMYVHNHTITADLLSASGAGIALRFTPSCHLFLLPLVKATLMPPPRALTIVPGNTTVCRGALLLLGTMRSCPPGSESPLWLRVRGVGGCCCGRHSSAVAHGRRHATESRRVHFSSRSIAPAVGC